MAPTDDRRRTSAPTSAAASATSGPSSASTRSCSNEGPHRVSPFFIPSAIVNLAAGQVSIRTGAKGPNSATATACSAGAHAIGDSFKIIQRGDADVMICGGAESAITPMSVAGFAAMRALSTRNDDPVHASRPFERDRDGFVIGEGAGMMIIEELEFARARGAKIYAELVGYGMTADAFHITMPDETASGAVRVMRMAMRDAGVEPERSATSTRTARSTPYNDKFETLAIKKTFGEHAYKLAVSSTKSMTGHLLGAAGGIEAVFSVLAINAGRAAADRQLLQPRPRMRPRLRAQRAARGAHRLRALQQLRLRRHQRGAALQAVRRMTGAAVSSR